MAYKITISKRASVQLVGIFNYLLINRSELIASEFINKVDSKLKNLSEYPFSYQKSHSAKGIRRCVVTKEVSIYYKITKDRVRIIFVFDTRQSPDKLKF